MDTLLDSSLSAAVTILFQSTFILASALVAARLLGRNSSLRYPVLLSALTITFLAAAWTAWNPASSRAIVIGTAQSPASSTAPAVSERGNAQRTPTPSGRGRIDLSADSIRSPGIIPTPRRTISSPSELRPWRPLRAAAVTTGKLILKGRKPSFAIGIPSPQVCSG